MDIETEKDRLPAVLAVCGVLVAVMGVFRVLAFALNLVDFLSSQYLSDIMSSGSGTQIILAFVLDIALTVVVAFAAIGLFRRRSWSFALTVIAAVCSILAILLEVFKATGLALLSRLFFLALDVAILALAGAGKRHLLHFESYRSEDG